MLNLSSLDGGHMCNGKWKKLPQMLCSSCRPVSTTPTFGVPTSLEVCTGCGSKWITDGKCDKCGTEMSWLKTNRRYYTRPVQKANRHRKRKI